MTVPLALPRVARRGALSFGLSVAYTPMKSEGVVRPGTALKVIVTSWPATKPMVLAVSVALACIAHGRPDTLPSATSRRCWVRKNIMHTLLSTAKVKLLHREFSVHLI